MVWNIIKGLLVRIRCHRLSMTAYHYVEKSNNSISYTGLPEFSLKMNLTSSDNLLPGRPPSTQGFALQPWTLPFVPGMFYGWRLICPSEDQPQVGYLKYFFIQFIKVLGKFGTFFKILEPGEAKHSNFYEFGQDMPNGMVVLLNTS